MISKQFKRQIKFNIKRKNCEIKTISFSSLHKTIHVHAFMFVAIVFELMSLVTNDEKPVIKLTFWVTQNAKAPEKEQRNEKFFFLSRTVTAASALNVCYRLVRFAMIN
jgi:hypothetical protein